MKAFRRAGVISPSGQLIQTGPTKTAVIRAYLDDGQIFFTEHQRIWKSRQREGYRAVCLWCYTSRQAGLSPLEADRLRAQNTTLPEAMAKSFPTVVT